MKNRIIALLMAMMMLLPSLSVFAAIENINNVIYFVDSIERSPELVETDGAIGSIAKRTYMKFRVDFGDKGASKLTVTYGVTSQYANKTVYVYVDSMNKSEPDFQFKTKSTGDWTIYSPSEFAVDNTVFSSGEHDIYFYFTSNGAGNFYSFRFDEEYIGVSDFDLKLCNADGTETDSVSEAANAYVSASISTLDDESFNAEVFAGFFDNNHKLIAKGYDNVVSETEISTGVTIAEDGQHEAAYFWVGVFINGKPVKSEYVGNPGDETFDEEFESGVFVNSGGGVVNVYGKSDNAPGNTIILKVYNEEIIYMREIPHKNGAFSTNFPIDADTGIYTAEIIDSEGNVISTEFEFISDAKIIKAIKEASDADVLEQLINDNHEMLEIDTSLVDSRPDKQWIYQMIYSQKEQIETSADIRELYTLYMVLAKINSGELEGLFEEYQVLLEISDGDLAMYVKNKDEFNSKIVETISEQGEISDISEFSELYYKIVVEPQIINAYSVTTFSRYTEQSGTLVVTGDVMGNSSPDSWVSFKNVDFGETKPKSFNIVSAAGSGFSSKAIKVYFDDKSKASPDITITPVDTGDWEKYQEFQYYIPPAVSQKLTGKHDIYIVFTAFGQGNYKSFFFSDEYTKFDGVVVTMYDAEGNITENISQAAEISASADIFRATGRNNNESLVLALYDENNTLIKIKSDSRLSFDDSEAQLEAWISGFEMSDKHQVYANVIGDELITHKQSTMINSKSYETVNDCEQLIVKSNDGTVSIKGKTSDDAEYITVYIRNKDTDERDFENYAFVYEIPVKKCLYAVDFVMPQDKATGDYEAVAYDSNKNTYTAQFHFVSKSDIETALDMLNGSTDFIQTETVLNNNTDVFEIDLTYINSRSNKAELYKYIFEENKINRAKNAVEVRNMVSGAEAIDKLNSGENAYEIVKKYSDGLKLSEEAVYEKYIEKVDSGIFNKYFLQNINRDGKLTAISGFDRVIKEVLVLSLLENEISWGNIDQLFNDFSDILTLNNFDKYKSMTMNSKYNICNQFINKDISTLEAVRALFDKSYRSEAEAVSGASKPSGGGGGGGGGGGTSAPAIVGTTPEKKEPEEKPAQPQEEKVIYDFKDMENYEWAKEAVKVLADTGIINGLSSNEFAPSRNVTREEFVKMLIIAFGMPESYNNADFWDVDKNAWYYPYIAVAKQIGIVNGYEDGSFGTGKSISRQELITMAHRAAEKYHHFINESNKNISFVDFEDVDDYAKDSIMTFARAGIVSGVGEDIINPKGQTSRAEAAVIIYRLLYN